MTLSFRSWAHYADHESTNMCYKLSGSTAKCRNISILLFNSNYDSLIRYSIFYECIVNREHSARSIVREIFVS